jgi:AAA15 family ATPase/GTPase
MLIQFSVGNYRSFKERTVFSMVAANTKSKDPLINKNNVFHEENNLELLTSTAIYGANSSGKSNLVKALAFMRQFVLTSASTPIDSLIPVEPFQLST